MSTRRRADVRAAVRRATRRRPPTPIAPPATEVASSKATHHATPDDATPTETNRCEPSTASSGSAQHEPQTKPTGRLDFLLETAPKVVRPSRARAAAKPTDAADLSPTVPPVANPAGPDADVGAIPCEPPPPLDPPPADSSAFAAALAQVAGLRGSTLAPSPRSDLGPPIPRFRGDRDEAPVAQDDLAIAPVHAWPRLVGWALATPLIAAALSLEVARTAWRTLRSR